ncbi:hypothetical protein F5Y07DRAFT_410526 [Xylaria sp. FL0933]|nr:hypothetical protein F5Y07DRAFT_410526 [Xylaria sp. FL0933]
MSSLTEFHYYPKLPRELKDMIWEIYSESLPTARHYFCCENYEKGFELHAYRLNSEEGNVPVQFRDKRDEFSSVYGILTIPKHITFTNTPTDIGRPSPNRGSLIYVAANYKKDIFSFDIDSRRPSCGGAIAKYFGVNSKTILDKDGKPSLLIKGGEEHSIIDEKYQSIFSARRIAFQCRSLREDRIFETFTEYDLQMLARFKRLKQIVFVVPRLEDVPDSVVDRAIAAKSLPHVFSAAGYRIIGYLNSVEREQLLKGYHAGVEVAYIQSCTLASSYLPPLMGPEGPVDPEPVAYPEESEVPQGEPISNVLFHAMDLSPLVVSEEFM